ncbi:MAG: phosphomannomutase/phosphoglucomutase [Cellvibrionaceae bacterium]
MSQPLPSIEEVDVAEGEAALQAATQAEGSAVSIPDNIFRDYDIRGIANTEITESLAEQIGQAVGSEALDHGETQLIVGRDGRNTSDSFSEQLIQGILRTGCSVVNIGPATTPMMYFACHHFDGINSGVEVTASHNPAEYNGFKIMINGETLFGEAIQKLKQRIQQGNFHQGKGSEQPFDVAEAYTLRILEDIILDEFKVVVDAGNGIAGAIAPNLLEELGCEVTPLYCDVDGSFPNHTPDPSIEENLSDLVAKVSEIGADLGIALDGDGDRLCLVTASGRILWPDEILMLLARDVITRNPGCDILYDVKSSRHLGELISSYGGRPVMWKTGHSHMKTKLKQLNAPLGGEFSGHIFFNERWFGFDDGLYAAARVMEIMTLREQSLDDMAAAIPTSVTTPELKITVDENHKFELIQSLTDSGNFDDAKLTKIDGIRADYPHGWGLVRASNTSPALTLRFEADSPDALKNIQEIFRRELQAVDNQLSLPF